MAGQILTSARVQEAEEWSEGRRRYHIYRKGRGISLNRAVRAIIDLRWYVVNTTGDVRPVLPPTHPLPPYRFPSQVSSSLSSFAFFATDVPLRTSS